MVVVEEEAAEVVEEDSEEVEEEVEGSTEEAEEVVEDSTEGEEDSAVGVEAEDADSQFCDEAIFSSHFFQTLNNPCKMERRAGKKKLSKNLLEMKVSDLI